MKITICGSIAFYKEMESARDELIGLCHEVKIPELDLEVPPENLDQVEKYILVNL